MVLAVLHKNIESALSKAIKASLIDTGPGCRNDTVILARAAATTKVVAVVRKVVYVVRVFAC